MTKHFLGFRYQWIQKTFLILLPLVVVFLILELLTICLSYFAPSNTIFSLNDARAKLLDHAPTNNPDELSEPKSTPGYMSEYVLHPYLGFVLDHSKISGTNRFFISFNQTST